MPSNLFPPEKRTVSQVQAERNSPMGCCERFANMSGCDCLNVAMDYETKTYGGLLANSQNPTPEECSVFTRKSEVVDKVKLKRLAEFWMHEGTELRRLALSHCSTLSSDTYRSMMDEASVLYQCSAELLKLL